MKVIRAKRNIFVPQDPENPETSTMRLVYSGLVALVPTDFQLPEDACEELTKVKFEQKSKKPKESQ